jgi:hypothetical protein
LVAPEQAARAVDRTRSDATEAVAPNLRVFPRRPVRPRMNEPL